MEYSNYERARKKVREKRKFYSHFMTWGIMSIFFILLNLFTSDYFWAVFPILGWGIGVAFHGIKAFSINYGDDWEERQIIKEMKKLKERESFMYDDHTAMRISKDVPDSDFV